MNDYGNQCLYAAPIELSVVHIEAHAVGTLAELRQRDVSPEQQMRHVNPPTVAV
jgi:hypothetical protein